MKRAHSAGIIVYTIQVINNVPIRLYLLLYYPKGYWDLAKGHLEQNESPLEAAKRELKEETGLSAALDKEFEQELNYRFTDPTGNLVAKKVTYYLGKAASQEVVLSHEHEDYAWVSYEEALKKLTYKNAQQLLETAESYLNKS